MERQRDPLGIMKIANWRKGESGFRKTKEMFETISEKTPPSPPLPAPPGDCKSEEFHRALCGVLAEAQRVFTLVM